MAKLFRAVLGGVNASCPCRPAWALSILHTGFIHNLITRDTYRVDGDGNLPQKIAPYHVLWLAGERC
jgi:hypothetical protein